MYISPKSWYAAIENGIQNIIKNEAGGFKCKITSACLFMMYWLEILFKKINRTCS